jgi:hypothetical protein
MSDEPNSDPTPSSLSPSRTTTPDPATAPDTKPDQAKSADGSPSAGRRTQTKVAEDKPADTAPDGTAPEAKPDETKPDETKPDETKPDETKPDDGNAAAGKAADGQAADAKAADGKPADGKGKAGEAKADEAKAGDGKSQEEKERERRRSLVTTLLSVFVVLIVVTAFGYFGGLGPLGKLSQRRALNPPDLLGGMARITDQETRSRLELDQSAKALSKSNEGETSVEAYGDVASDTGLFVVIALRGKIDVNRTVADAGATADQVQTVGKDTCTTQTDDIVTCYRTSNTLTVMVRNSTGKVGADRVAPITDEAFNAYD